MDGRVVAWTAGETLADGDPVAAVLALTGLAPIAATSLSATSTAFTGTGFPTLTEDRHHRDGHGGHHHRHGHRRCAPKRRHGRVRRHRLRPRRPGADQLDRTGHRPHQVARALLCAAHDKPVVPRELLGPTGCFSGKPSQEMSTGTNTAGTRRR